MTAKFCLLSQMLEPHFLSDPGRLLVNECLINNIKVTPIPGASSITAAMSVSGFKDQFLFYGFLPKTINQLEKVFKLVLKVTIILKFFLFLQIKLIFI